ncbi:MAG: phosphoserine phosphatase SerB [Gammaproteobacteria bacterium]
MLYVVGAVTGQELQLPPCWQTDSGDDPAQFVADIINISDEELTAVVGCFQFNGLTIEHRLVTNQSSSYRLYFNATTAQAWTLFQQLISLAQQCEFDTSVMPVNIEPIRLLVCDMDSTIVASETLDDLAEKANLGERVKEITTRAMRGEIDFIGALQERVNLLKGVDAKLLQEVITAIKFNSGAEELITTARQNGIRTVLVSGGFEAVVAHVAGQLGFDRYVCNQLDVVNGKLSGKVLEPIVDSCTKLQTLKEECALLGISTRQSCCIGDGANDLPMLQEAGVGISYMGKPLLKALLPYQVNSSDLAYVISVLGLH